MSSDPASLFDPLPGDDKEGIIADTAAEQQNAGLGVVPFVNGEAQLAADLGLPPMAAEGFTNIELGVDQPVFGLQNGQLPITGLDGLVGAEQALLNGGTMDDALGVPHMGSTTDNANSIVQPETLHTTVTTQSVKVEKSGTSAAAESSEPAEAEQRDEDDDEALDADIFGDDDESLNNFGSDAESEGDDDINTPSGSKKRKRRPGVGEGEEHGSAGVDDEPSDNPENSSIQDKVNQVRVDFEQAIASLKPKRKKRQVDEKALDDMLQGLTDVMVQAAKQDDEALSNEKPRLHKLRVLPAVMKHFERHDRHDYLIDNNILQGIRAWLEPMEDGSLPPYDVRKNMLNALEKLPINRDVLRESGIGRVIMFYKQCPKEEKELQRTAEKLCTKWSRLVINKSDDYRTRSRPSVPEAEEAPMTPRSRNSRGPRTPNPLRSRSKRMRT